jgi:MFS family permease
MQDFRDPRARWEFAAVCAVTFLAFLSGSSLSLLAIVLQRDGHSDGTIGLILGAGMAPYAVSALLAGPLIGRFGSIRPMLAAIALMMLGHVALEFVHTDAWLTFATRIVGGAGAGVCVPAAMLYAQTRLTERRFVYLFGIFTTMLPLPNAVGPALAELYLQHVGVNGFFLATTAPALVALGLASLLRRGAPATRSGGRPLSYLAVLRMREIRLVFVGYLVFGAILGFGGSYMAVLLHARDLSVAAYFTSFTVSLFAARFVVMSKIHAVSRDAVILAGALLQSSAFLLLYLGSSLWATILVGLLYGLGHSVMFPSLTAWVNAHIPPSDRGVSTALTQAIFAIGITLTPLLGGPLVARLGLDALVLVLSLLGFAVAAVVLPRVKSLRAV